MKGNLPSTYSCETGIDPNIILLNYYLVIK